MAALPRTRPPLQRPDRRSFLWSLASLGFRSRIPKPEKQSEQVYRFLTPVREVRMSVQYFASSSTSSFRFRDDLTNRSMAIAQYHFRSRRHSFQQCQHLCGRHSADESHRWWRRFPTPRAARLLQDLGDSNRVRTGYSTGGYSRLAPCGDHSSTAR
jgi:hypothetical protein